MAANAKREFRILGPFEVCDDGQPLSVGRGKQRALLALLLLNAGEVVSTDRLIDALWGEAPPASALNSVHIYVSQLRKVLGNGRLATRGHGYVLELEPDELDVDVFERMLGEGRELLMRGEAERAREVLRGALALWRGGPLVDFASEPFAQREIARLEELRLAALESRIEADLALGHHTALIGELESLTAEHRLNERFWAQLMFALYRAGRQAAALDAYRQARRDLHEQVGLEPGPELRRLHKAILTHDPSLAPAQRDLPATRRILVKRRLQIGSATVAAVVIAGVALLLTRGSSSAALAAISPDSIGIVDPERNALVGEIRLHARPAAIAFGASSLWVATYDRQTLLRIDPRTREVHEAIGLGAQPTALAVGDGYVWVLCGPAHVLFQFDAERKSLVRKHTLSAKIRVRPNRGLPYAPLGVGYGEPFDLAAGAGAAWVGYAHAVSRVDAATGDVQQIRAGSNGGIGFGEHALWTVGKLWFDSQQEVSRIDPETRSVTERIPPANVGAERGFGAPTAGAGAVWTISGAGRRAWKVDPRIGRVSDVIPLYHGPVDVAIGEGAVWTANDDGTVSRIEPKTATLARTIPLGDYPRTAYPVALAVGGRAVWVAVH